MHKSDLISSKSAISTVAGVVIAVVVIIILVVAGAVYFLGSGSVTTTQPTTSVAGTTAASSISSSVSSSSTTTSSAVSTSSSTVEVVFGASLSLTGSGAPFGTEDNWTLNQAVNYINSIGGIPLKSGGHAMIKLIILNDQSSDTTGISNLQQLVSTYHVNVLMGQLGTIDDTILANFASKNSVPIIGPYYLASAKTCATPDCSGSWTFGTFHNETNEAHVFLNWFKTVDAPKAGHDVTIAFFEEPDDSAQANLKAGEAYATQLGYTICTCSDTNFQYGSSSEMQTFISAAKQAGADAVFGLPIPSDAVLMINTAKQLGYEPKAWLLTRGTAVAPFALSQLGGLGNLTSGVMSAFPWEPDLPYSANILGHNVSNADISAAYTQSQGHPPLLEGVYYSGVAVAADAISMADNLSNVAIRASIRSHTFQTFMGPMSFTAGGQWIQSDQYMLMMQWQIIPFQNTTLPVLQILVPQGVATTNYVFYPFTFTNQQKMPWP